jgi:hypothetical protein
MSVPNYKPDYSRKHGEATTGRETKLYKTWLNMRETLNAHDPVSLKLYGGLPEYEPWRDYRVFREWSLSNGYRENLKLARIDKRKGFSPDNCRWQKSPKMIRVVCVETGEEFDCIADAARKHSIRHHEILRALRTGWKTRGLRWRYLDPEPEFSCFDKERNFKNGNSN